DARQWEKSGHWGKYRENMFVVPDEIPSTEDDAPVLSGDADLMALKPMNCPGHILVFKQGITSYKELPIRFYENASCHRNGGHGDRRVRLGGAPGRRRLLRAQAGVASKGCDRPHLAGRHASIGSCSARAARRDLHR